MCSAGVDRFDDGRICAAEAVAEDIDIGDLNLARQMRDDLLHRCVQVLTVLKQVAGNPGARCGNDEPGKVGEGIVNT